MTPEERAQGIVALLEKHPASTVEQGLGQDYFATLRKLVACEIKEAETAARSEALEEAAKVAEDYLGSTDDFGDAIKTKNIAYAIRALKDKGE